MDIYLRTCSIINCDTRKWNLSRLERLINSEDRKLIVSIHLSIGYKEDRIIWPYEKHGLLIVKVFDFIN